MGKDGSHRKTIEKCTKGMKFIMSIQFIAVNFRH